MESTKNVTYEMIIRLGDLNDFLKKLKDEGRKIDEIKDRVDDYGVSLLERALVNRKFDIAKYLLENNAKINVVTKAGNNELHCIAANINVDGAIEVAKMLVERSVSLTLQDLKYGNSAMFTLCQEVFKKRSDEGNAFIIDCLRKCIRFDDVNKAGYSVRSLIMDRGNEDMKKVLEAV